jgi:uncharacterized SAM-binding protein YcdF (DUF218 family)
MGFVVGKLVWLVLSPGNMLALILGAGAACMLVSRRRRGLSLVVLAALGFLAFMILPIGDWLMAPLEERFPIPAPMPERVDGIIVLGGAVDEIVSAARGRVELNDAGTRMTDAVALVRRYPSARVVLTGGNNHIVESMPPEAGIMKAFFVAEGVDPVRITLETQSRTTYENALFTHAQVRPNPGETWLLVTSAAHMPRAVGCFRRQGWNVVSYPVDFHTAGNGSFQWDLALTNHLVLATKALREWVGLVGYRLTDRTDSLFPGPS